MTREEAIKAFRGLYGVLLPREYYREAIQMAIEALSREPSEDAVSREAAIDALEQAKEQYFDRKVIIGKMQDVVSNLPSAQPDKRLEKIADLVEGTINHFDRDDAMDLLYQIKEVLNEK